MLGGAPINGPPAGFTTTFELGTASVSLSSFAAWAGTVVVNGSPGLLTLSAVVMSSTGARLTSGGGSVTIVSSTTLRGTITSTAPASMAITGTVASGGLVITSPASTLTLTGGTITTNTNGLVLSVWHALSPLLASAAWPSEWLCLVQILTAVTALSGVRLGGGGIGTVLLSNSVISSGVTVSGRQPLALRS